MSITNSHIATVIRRIRGAVRDLPDPSVTLVGKKWGSPFRVLVSCLLSLRTKDETTLPAAQRLFAKADTPAKILRLSILELEKLIYPVGFYHTKARTLQHISRDLIERYHGQVPGDIDELLTLKGVGRKTANLVMIEGFHQPAICVDTHVHRISNRWGYIKTRNPLETEQALRKKLPKLYWMDYNALLVTWGQNVCRPVSPLCSRCVVREFCPRKNVRQCR